MIEDTDEGTLASCDYCSTVVLLKDRIGHKIREHLRRKGWAVYPEGGAYTYECPCCVETRFVTGNEQVQEKLSKA